MARRHVLLLLSVLASGAVGATDAKPQPVLPLKQAVVKPSRGTLVPPARHVQLSLLFGSRLVQTIMRMAMGPLVVFICDEMKCDASTRGTLLSAYSLGYLLTQVAGGALSDRVGSKLVILISTMLGALCTACCAMTKSVSGLWWAQALLGASQGPLFPVSIGHLAAWLPPDERSMASTALDTGITVGSLVALPFSGALAARLGWRGTLYVYAALGLAFCFLWQALGAVTPDRCSYIRAEEREYLHKVIKFDAGKSGTSNADAPAKRLSIRKMLGIPAIWAIFVSHMAFNFGTYFLTSWGPTYYEDAFKIRPEHAAFAFVLPPALNCATKIVLNKPLETWMRSSLRWGTLECRRAFTVAGFVGTALAMLMVTGAKHAVGIHGSTLCWSLAFGFAALHPAGFKTNYMDISRTSSGVISGVGNTMASIASYVGPLAVGYLLKTFGSWVPAFMSVALVNVLAATAFGTLSTVSPVD